MSDDVSNLTRKFLRTHDPYDALRAGSRAHLNRRSIRAQRLFYCGGIRGQRRGDVVGAKLLRLVDEVVGGASNVRIQRAAQCALSSAEQVGADVCEHVPGECCAFCGAERTLSGTGGFHLCAECARTARVVMRHPRGRGPVAPNAGPPLTCDRCGANQIAQRVLAGRHARLCESCIWAIVGENPE